eukprot:352159-Chlamydomonas_euryale.AAC.4
MAEWTARNGCPGHSDERRPLPSKTRPRGTDMSLQVLTFLAWQATDAAREDAREKAILTVVWRGSVDVQRRRDLLCRSGECQGCPSRTQPALHTISMRETWKGSGRRTGTLLRMPPPLLFQGPRPNMNAGYCGWAAHEDAEAPRRAIGMRGGTCDDACSRMWGSAQQAKDGSQR